MKDLLFVFSRKGIPSSEPDCSLSEGTALIFGLDISPILDPTFWVSMGSIPLSSTMFSVYQITAAVSATANTAWREVWGHFMLLHQQLLSVHLQKHLFNWKLSSCLLSLSLCSVQSCKMESFV